MRRSIRLLALLCALPLLSGCSFIEPITVDENAVPIPQISVPEIGEDGPKDTSLYGVMLDTLSKGGDHVSYIGTADAEEVGSTFRQLLQDHPEIFWTTNITSDINGPLTEIHFTLMEGYSAEQFVQMLAQTNSAAEAAAAAATGLVTDYEKALYAHDLLVESVTYDYDSQQESGFGIDGTPYGALVNHKATGRGYADAFLLLMHKLGVEAGTCQGMTAQGEHAWNYVKLDGAYYWMDAAWDDSQSDEAPHVIRHTYCFLPDDRFLSQRTVYSENYFVPECTEMKDCYFTVEDAYFPDYNFDVISAHIAADVEKGASELMFSDEVIANVAVTELIENGGIWRVPGVSGSNLSVSYSLSGDSHVLLLVFAPKE